MNNLIKLVDLKKIVLCCFVIGALCTSFGSQAQELKLKYFGAAGWEIKDGKSTILLDPYITRTKFTRNDHYQSDTVAIDKLITNADFIFVHHSHPDHLGDVPYIAKKTGAKVIGTETTTNILRAYGVPKDQIYTVRGGEDYQFENFSVRVVPSIHSALNKKQYFDSRTQPSDLKAPIHVKDFVEGGSLMFLLRLPSHKILTAGSMNYVEREVEGLRPDIIMPGVNFSRNEIYKYTERLLKATGLPKIVIPTHWDNFRVPYGSAKAQEKAVNDKIKPFIEEVKAASPNSKVITPVHLETITIK